MEFDYTAVKEALPKILDMSFDRMTVAPEQVTGITELLHLNWRNVRGLRAIRNAVVRLLSDKMRNEAGIDDRGRISNFEAADRIQVAISAVTAVIDREIWNQGGEV